MYAESQVRTAPGVQTVEVSNVPVWVAAPPELLNEFEVTLEPRTVNITVTGAPDRLEAFSQEHNQSHAVAAYLDLDTTDRQSTGILSKALRFSTPPGLTVPVAPLVTYSLTRKKPKA